MSEAGVLTIRTDGGARGNPGPAAYAYVIERAGAPSIEEAGCLGHSTNNVAEYTALVRALEHARELGGRVVNVFSDSELMVKQMNGQYKVKNEDLRALYEEARELCREFEKVTIRHVRREQNRRADELYNEALDGFREPTPRPPAKPKPQAEAKQQGKASAEPAPVNAVREAALNCLRQAAAAWSNGTPEKPSPEDVWDQLCAILASGGHQTDRGAVVP
jgi:ribonuclease HI